MLSVGENTIHIYGSGALNLTDTVMDTADVLADEKGVVSVWKVVEYIKRQGVAIQPPQAYHVLDAAVRFHIMQPLGSGIYQWLDVGEAHG